MIRLTTPKLNFVIVSGAVLMYLSVFIGLLPTVDKSVVHAQCTVSLYNEWPILFSLFGNVINETNYIHRSMSGCMV